jgi:hypothetical protein
LEAEWISFYNWQNSTTGGRSTYISTKYWLTCKKIAQEYEEEREVITWRDGDVVERVIIERSKDERK